MSLLSEKLNNLAISANIKKQEEQIIKNKRQHIEQVKEKEAQKIENEKLKKLFIKNLQDKIVNPLHSYLDSLYPNENELKAHANKGKFKYIILAFINDRKYFGDKQIYRSINFSEDEKGYQGYYNNYLGNIRLFKDNLHYNGANKLMVNGKHLGYGDPNNIKLGINVKTDYIVNYLCDKFKDNELSIRHEKASHGWLTKINVLYISWDDSKKLNQSEINELYKLTYVPLTTYYDYP